VKWIELTVEAHPEAVDAIANVFQNHGTGGVAIEQPVESHIEGEEPPRFSGRPVIRAYLPLNGQEPAIERRIEEDLWHLRAFNLSPVSELRRREIDEQDWANEWKQHFHPLRIGRVVIKPSWREWAAQPDQLIVELDPGMAFGTGLHPTTRLMIEALQDRVRPGMAVLDLGTGSGILAIPAALLGATVDALDVSEVAADVARDNVARNGLDARVTVAPGTIDAVEGRQYDLILANIIASVLVDLAPQLFARLRPGAQILASGIIEERLPAVRHAFQTTGLETIEERRDEDWYLLIARRPV
jgi:ribosomal protein L11 methyltransferase